MTEFGTEAFDPAAKQARRALANTFAATLTKVGEQTQVIGVIAGTGRTQGTSPFGNGEDGVVELGYLYQIAGELTGGAAQLLEAEKRYPAAALVRQLVEVDYLAWSFAARPELGGDWLRSTIKERRDTWRPGKLREMSDGKFDSEEYSQHCELGGHPTPAGARALVGSSVDPAFTIELLWSEICEHDTRILENLIAALEVLDIVLALDDELSALETALFRWREVDELGRALKRAASEQK